LNVRLIIVSCDITNHSATKNKSELVSLRIVYSAEKNIVYVSEKNTTL